MKEQPSTPQRCETTLTMRYPVACQCGSIGSGIGPCVHWEPGANPERCVYCDHIQACHHKAAAWLEESVAQSESTTINAAPQVPSGHGSGTPTGAPSPAVAAPVAPSAGGTSVDQAVRDAYRSALTYAASLCESKVFDRQDAFDNGCWTCAESIKAELAAINRDNPGDTPVSAMAPMIHAAWRYLNKKTGEETLTHQPPDRVLFADDYEVIELFARDPMDGTTKNVPDRQANKNTSTKEQ